METKREIRRRLLRMRSDCPDRIRSMQSQEVAEFLYLCPAFSACRTLFTYVSFREEVDTFPIIRKSLLSGKRVAVPKVCGSEMEFFEIRDFGELSAGTFGILEPKGENTPLIPGRKDLILLPGVGFDHQGYRIGYGGGFYDRYLKRNPGVPTIALAYDFQMLEQLPTEPFDIAADEVIFPGRYARMREESE